MDRPPIPTTRLLMDLEEVAKREGLRRRDPWQAEPAAYPDEASHAVVLRLDGKVERVILDEVYLDWGTIVAYRYETPWGSEVDEFDMDSWSPY